MALDYQSACDRMFDMDIVIVKGIFCSTGMYINGIFLPVKGKGMLLPLVKGSACVQTVA